MTSSPVTVEPCTVPCGPTIPVSRDPLEMFSYFFTDDLLSHIVRETNRYAAQYLAATNSTTSWETTIDELKAYLGFMVVMGLNNLTEIRDYWSSNTRDITTRRSPSPDPKRAASGELATQMACTRHADNRELTTESPSRSTAVPKIHSRTPTK